jgi:hypothetical protein
VESSKPLTGGQSPVHQTPARPAKPRSMPTGMCHQRSSRPPVGQAGGVQHRSASGNVEAEEISTEVCPRPLTGQSQEPRSPGILQRGRRSVVQAELGAHIVGGKGLAATANRIAGKRPSPVSISLSLYLSISLSLYLSIFLSFCLRLPVSPSRYLSVRSLRTVPRRTCARTAVTAISRP